MTFREEQAAVAAAAATFPPTFSLKAFPGVVVYVNLQASFYSEYSGGVQLVLTRVDGHGDMGRDTPEIIRSQMVATPTVHARAGNGQPVCGTRSKDVTLTNGWPAVTCPDCLQTGREAGPIISDHLLRSVLGTHISRRAEYIRSLMLDWATRDALTFRLENTCRHCRALKSQHIDRGHGVLYCSPTTTAVFEQEHIR